MRRRMSTSFARYRAANHFNTPAFAGSAGAWPPRRWAAEEKIGERIFLALLAARSTANVPRRKVAQVIANRLGAATKPAAKSGATCLGINMPTFKPWGAGFAGGIAALCSSTTYPDSTFVARLAFRPQNRARGHAGIDQSLLKGCSHILAKPSANKLHCSSLSNINSIRVPTVVGLYNRLTEKGMECKFPESFQFWRGPS